MPTRAHRIEDWEFSPDDRLFFDTNIWLLLLGEQGSPTDPIVAIYSAAYKRILKAQSQILTDTLVLAEFANASLRLRHELELRFAEPGEVPTNFKEFRSSADGRDAVQGVSDLVRTIVEGTQVLPSEPPADWAIFHQTLSAGQRDFNDELIVEQFQRKQAILVTHDRDFADADIEVLTCQPKYFRRRAR